MFADIGNGTLINLALIAKVQIVNMGTSGTVFKFYSTTNDLVAEHCPDGPEEMERLLSAVQSFRPHST